MHAPSRNRDINAVPSSRIRTGELFAPWPSDSYRLIWRRLRAHRQRAEPLLCDIDSDVIAMAVVGSLTKYVWVLPSAKRRASSRVRGDLCP
jgi:hypothetical protein